MARLTSWLFRLIPLLLLPLAAGALAQQAPSLQARDVALVNRVTWGATPTELARAQTMGIDRYLLAQLHPAAQAPLPAEVQRRIDALSISTQSDEQARAAQIDIRQKAKDQSEEDKLSANRQARKMARERGAEVGERACGGRFTPPINCKTR